MELGLLLPISAVIVFSAIIYAILEVITCVLRPTVSDDPLGLGHGHASRRKRLLSLYDIYKPSHEDIAISSSKLPSGNRRASIPTTVETINEESDLPPSYTQAVTSIALSPIQESDTKVVVNV